MTELYYAVLKASFQGSVVILAVLLLRQLLKKAPKSVFCLLWLLAGLRLLLPFEIQSKLSLQPDYTLVPQAVAVPDDRENILDSQGDILIDIPDNLDSVPDTPAQPEVNLDDLPVTIIPTPQPDRQKLSFEEVAAPIWLLGVGIMVLASLWSYWKLKRRVRMAYLIENGCFECPGLDTAFVLGFLPPKIYLPAGLTDGEKKFIFDHENTHIARGDHWFKLLGYLVLSLHWFNPLVWVGYSLLCRDIELACDEQVVKFMSLQQRKAYSAALLSCGGHTARIAACPVAFGESNPKKRILNVLNYKRPGFWISLAAVIAVIFVAVCLLTSPGNPSLLEFGNVADEELYVICIGSKNGLADVSHPDDTREIQKLLDSISWEKDTPTERPDESDGYVILFNSLLAEDALYFSEDCSLVWAENTKAYPVSDARKLREYLDTLTEAVLDREISGEPFANISQPVQWLRGISESAVREAEIYMEKPTVQEGNTSSTTRSMGVMSARDFNALLDILNGLPESAIVSESTLSGETFTRLRGSLVPHGGMTLTVYDDVNQLVMILRLVKDDVIEFILIDELEKVEGEHAYLDHPRCWIIEDDTLLAFLKQMQAHPMIIYPNDFFGHDTSDAEETLPAWNMEMTDEEFMELCRSAVAEFQSRESYHVSESLAYYVNDREDARNDVAYWSDGINNARQSYIPRTGETRTHLYYDGQLYYRVQADGGDPTWSLVESDHGEEYNLTWLHLLDWDAQMVTFEYAEQAEDMLHVFVTVHSSVQPLGWYDVHEYTVGFFFDHSGNMTNALMGAVRDNLNVMSDLKIETTSADSVRTKLEQMAQQRPADLVQELNASYVEKCREAMVALKNSEELYLYVTDLNDPMETTNVYMHAPNGWLFKYRHPGWDCEEVQWLCVGNTQYIYGGEPDGNGVMATPYYWQVEKNPGNHNYQLPYPFDLDWENIELTYEGTVTENDTETVTILFPLYLDQFTFHFDMNGELSWFDVGDSTGEPEATTSRFYVLTLYDVTVADHLTQLYEEASTQAGQKPGIPDDAFYEELFTRKTDGHYTEQWSYDLFKAFYAYPAEFVSHLAQSDRAQEIVTHMGNNVNYYAPYRFASVLTELGEDPDTDQTILAMLEAIG